MLINQLRSLSRSPRLLFCGPLFHSESHCVCLHTNKPHLFFSQKSPSAVTSLSISPRIFFWWTKIIFDELLASRSSALMSRLVETSFTESQWYLANPWHPSPFEALPKYLIFLNNSQLFPRIAILSWNHENWSGNQECLAGYLSRQMSIPVSKDSSARRYDPIIGSAKGGVSGVS